MSTPPTVPATTKFLELLQASDFSILEDFHPAYPDSLTLIDPSTHSGITIIIVESADNS